LITAQEAQIIIIVMDYFYVYVLRSVDFKRNYVGFTENVERRLKEHNSGKTKSTKPYRPWKLLFFETFISKIWSRSRLY